MAAPTELYVDAFPDMGEMGPPHRHITHAACRRRMQPRPHPVTGDITLLCPKCGLQLLLSESMMDNLDRAAILQLPRLIPSDCPRKEPDILVSTIPSI